MGPKETAVRSLIEKWKIFRASINDRDLYCQLKQDLYQVRNPDFNGSPPLSYWRSDLVDPDDEIMAAVEHYFLGRCWVGSGYMPAWELRLLTDIYDAGKMLRITPRHNPNNPVTPPSALQKKFQLEGIAAGEVDRMRFGIPPPGIKQPPTY